MKKFLVPASARTPRGDCADVVERVEPWSAPALERARRGAGCRARGSQMKDVAQPARVALTGRAASPGLFDVIAVLGRERAMRRLRAGASASQSP